MYLAGIQYRSDIALTEYLSNPDERLRWHANSLPTDDLCTENAIMLKVNNNLYIFLSITIITVWLHLIFYFQIQRYNRYPLIIDPSGQATEFILKEYADAKITKTSFLDDSFRKNLESALRFGNPLLVQVSLYCVINLLLYLTRLSHMEYGIIVAYKIILYMYNILIIVYYFIKLSIYFACLKTF